MLKEVVLVITLLMPANVPDVQHAKPMPSLESCWAEAQAFTTRELSDPMRQHGVLGLGATCAWREKPSTVD